MDKNKNIVEANKKILSKNRSENSIIKNLCWNILNENIVTSLYRLVSYVCSRFATFVHTHTNLHRCVNIIFILIQSLEDGKWMCWQLDHFIDVKCVHKSNSKGRGHGHSRVNFTSHQFTLNGVNVLIVPSTNRLMSSTILRSKHNLQKIS